MISSRVIALNNIWSNVGLREFFLLHDSYSALFFFVAVVTIWNHIYIYYIYIIHLFIYCLSSPWEQGSCLFYSLLYPQQLEQCLAHNRLLKIFNKCMFWRDIHSFFFSFLFLAPQREESLVSRVKRYKSQEKTPGGYRYLRGKEEKGSWEGGQEFIQRKKGGIYEANISKISN